MVYSDKVLDHFENPRHERTGAASLLLSRWYNEVG